MNGELNRRFKIWAVSIALHAALLVGLALWFTPSYREGGRNGKPVAAAVANGGSSEAPPAPGNELLEGIQSSLAAAESLPVNQQMQAVLERAKQLERISSVESMQEIGDLLKQKLPQRARAFAPSDKPASGDFDYSDPVIHSVIRKRGPDGVEKPYYVMVDKAGRKVEVEAPAGSETTVALFERLQSSAVLRTLKDGILLPVLDWQSKPKDPSK